MEGHRYVVSSFSHVRSLRTLPVEDSVRVILVEGGKVRGRENAYPVRGRERIEGSYLAGVDGGEVDAVRRVFATPA